MAFESTLKKLNSALTAPETMGYYQSGAFAGIREKILSIGFVTLRNIVEQVPIFNAIINTRVLQVSRFTQRARERGDKGFEFVRTDGEPIGRRDEEAIKMLSGFVENTGWKEDDEREDDFSEWTGMLVRDTLEIDQVATELQRNRKGDVAAYWGLDGATIKRVDERHPERFRKDTQFVQEIDGEILEQYEPGRLIFDYMHKRSDIRYRGYGYSSTEQCVNVATTLLYGFQYQRDQLTRDRVPKGFISVMGDAGRDQLGAIRDYWQAAMSGAGGRWNIPILPSGKLGVGLDFKQIGSNNRDMEYHKLMMFLSAIAGAVFAMDLAEMGIKTDDSTALIGEDSAPRIQSSKDRGLAGMLAYIQQHMNKMVRKITEDYRFQFVGLEKEDEDKSASLRSKELQTRRTIDELREEDGLEPFKEPWSEIVLNPQAVQIYLSSQKGAQGMPGAPALDENGQPIEEGAEAGVNGQNGQNGENGQEQEETEVDWSALTKARDVRVVVR